MNRSSFWINKWNMEQCKHKIGCFDKLYISYNWRCIIILQFRLAYVAPESTVVGAGELVDDPKLIAKNYFYGFFFFDLFVVLPLPQVSIPGVLCNLSTGLFYNFINAVVLFMKNQNLWSLYVQIEVFVLRVIPSIAIHKFHWLVDWYHISLKFLKLVVC